MSRSQIAWSTLQILARSDGRHVPYAVTASETTEGEINIDGTDCSTTGEHSGSSLFPEIASIPRTPAPARWPFPIGNTVWGQAAIAGAALIVSIQPCAAA